MHRKKEKISPQNNTEIVRLAKFFVRFQKIKDSIFNRLSVNNWLRWQKISLRLIFVLDRAPTRYSVTPWTRLADPDKSNPIIMCVCGVCAQARDMQSQNCACMIIFSVLRTAGCQICLSLPPALRIYVVHIGADSSAARHNRVFFFQSRSPLALFAARSRTHENAVHSI